MSEIEMQIDKLENAYINGLISDKEYDEELSRLIQEYNSKIIR